MIVTFGLAALAVGPAAAQRQMESLNRGVVAVRKNTTQVYVGWRLFGNDPPDIAFNLYRSTNGAAAAKLNTAPLTATTDFTDSPGSTNLTNNAYAYSVRAVVNGIEQSPSETVTLPANSAQKQFQTIPLRADTGPNGPYTVKFGWVGDLDADGDYDFVVDRISTLGAFEQFLEVYRNDGTFLWRMAMGPNSINQDHIEPGSSAISVGDCDNVTVYDLDGDGRAEVLARTANGVTVTNAAGTQVAAVSAATETAQFLSVFDGQTGAELARAPIPNNWAAHGPMNCKALIAYLDGKRPSVVLHGSNRADTLEFYRQVTAWDFRGGALTQRWTWAQNPAVTPGSEAHQLRVADVDNDGKDEICDIGYVLDDNGTQLFTNILTHGDRFHIADIDPDRPGLETYAIQQNNTTMLATALYESGTGAMIKKWYAGGTVDVGRGIALDITAAHKGYEMYSTQAGIFNAKGRQIFANSIWPPEGLWWDGDLGREFIDGAGSGAYSPVINKFNAATGGVDRVWSLYNDWGTYSVRQSYGGRPAFWGDILGDWREELVFVQSDCAALRIYTTAAPATNRLYTLMHNPQYRCQTTTKGYVQASYVDYYLGFDMPAAVPPPPMAAADLTWNAGPLWDVGASASWKNASGASAAFSQGDRVLFDLSGSNAAAVALSGSLAPGAVSVFNPQDFTLDGSNGSLGGSMGLTKSGRGKLTLTGTHGFTGPATVWDGALVVNGILTSSPVTVWGGTWGGSAAKGLGGGRLAGTGTVSQSATVGYRGAITPGPGMGAPGTLAFGSDLSLADGAVLAFDVSNDPSGNTAPSDRIAVAGNLNLSGTVHLVINALNGTLTAGSYTLLTFGGSLAGSVSNISLTLPEGTPHTLSITGGAVVLTVPLVRAPANVVWTGGDGGNAWDLATTANWSRSGSQDVFVSGDTVTFDALGAANPVVTLNDALPVGGITVSSDSDYTLTGPGELAGTGGITKSGAGVLTITTTNSHTGPTVVTGGTLAVDNLAEGGVLSSIGASGNSAANLVLDGATLSITGGQSNTDRSLTLGANGGIIHTPSATVAISGKIIGAGRLTKTGAATLILANANTHAGGIQINEGKLLLATDTANVSGIGPGSVILNGGTLAMTEDDSMDSWATSAWPIHVPSGATGRLNADTRCNLTGSLTGSGDFTIHVPYVRTELLGDWSAFSGRISVVTDDDGGEFRPQNAAGWPSAHLDLGAGVSGSYNKTLSSGLTIPVGNLSGDATSSLRGGLSAGKTVTYQIGARGEDGVFAGTLRDGTGPAALIKIGAGTLTLAGANTHTGATLVSAGRLRITGSTSGSNITVQSGGTLGGTGTVTGNVVVQTGGGLEWSGSPLAIAGNLTFSGNATIRAAAGLVPAVGTLTVLTYTGTLTGAPVFTWEPPAGSTLVATFDTATAGMITMTLEEPPRQPGPITWTGNVSSDWDETTSNWQAGAAATTYQTGDSPSFTDAGNAAAAINLTTDAYPASVTVDSAKNYTFSGTGMLSGGATLAKAGSGTLVISSANTFTGGTTIHAGTVSIANAAALGTGTVTLNGGTWATGTLSPQNAVIVAANSTITGGDAGGTHAVKNITGSGVLTLSATNVFDMEGDISGFTGGIYLSGTGSFRFMTTTYHGSGGAAFDLGTRTLTARQGGAYSLGALSGQAGSALGMAGNNGSAVCTYTIGGANLDTSFDGVIANGSSTKKVAITKTGTGNLILTGASTYTGNTSVTQGKLTVNGSLAATATTVGPDGTLGGGGSIAGAVTCNGTLAPGSPSGTLSLGGGLVLSATSALDCELGTESDLIAVTGNLTLDGIVNVRASAGFGPGAFTLLTYTGSLTDSQLQIGSVPPGFTASVDTATTGQVRLTIVPTVLPATVTLANLAAVYDGSPKPVTVTTSPTGLATSLTYDGSPTPPSVPGSYAVNAAVTEPGYQGSATGTLVISPRNFANWEASRFTQQEILEGKSAPDADPDRDGLTNLAEYALGTDPHTFTPQPAVTRTQSELSLTFQRPAHVGDVIYQAETSRDLANWQPVALDALNPGADPETVRAVMDPAGSGTHDLYIRIRFTK